MRGTHTFKVSGPTTGPGSCGMAVKGGEGLTSMLRQDLLEC